MKTIESLWKTNFGLDLKDGWKLVPWEDFLKQHREMFSLFPGIWNLFMKLLEMGVWLHAICPVVSFPCFSMSCLLLIDLEQFRFPQEGLNSSAVCVVFFRGACEWGWVMTALRGEAWAGGRKGCWFGWISLGSSKSDVFWSLHGACFTCYTELRRLGLISKTNQAFLFWSPHCPSFYCDQ